MGNALTTMKDGTIVRVHFMNGVKRTFSASEEVTARHVIEEATKKIGIEPQPSFALYITSPAYERPLGPDDQPLVLMKNWSDGKKNKKFKLQLVYKKRLFF